MGSSSWKDEAALDRDGEAWETDFRGEAQEFRLGQCVQVETLKRQLDIGTGLDRHLDSKTEVLLEYKIEELLLYELRLAYALLKRAPIWIVFKTT